MNLIKTIKLSDPTHAQLTRIVGKLTAKTGKKQIYEGAVKALLKTKVLIPEDLLFRAEKLIEENKDLGYHSIEEFVEEAVRIRLAEATRQQKEKRNLQ